MIVSKPLATILKGYSDATKHKTGWEFVMTGIHRGVWRKCGQPLEPKHQKRLERDGLSGVQQ
jgi:hypothetical protein